MIFTLLANVIALHVGLTMVEIRELGFEQTKSKVWFRATHLHLEEQIYAEICDFLEVFFGV